MRTWLGWAGARAWLAREKMMTGMEGRHQEEPRAGSPGARKGPSPNGGPADGTGCKETSTGPRSPAGGQAGGFVPLSSGGPGRETVGSSSSTWQVDPSLQGGWITWAFELPFRAQSH